MKFAIKPRGAKKKYPETELKIARKFAKKVYRELGDFVVAMCLFGSSARGERKRHGDIDIIIIVDDVHVQLNKEIVETYRIIVAKAVADIDPKRLHVQTMEWSSFWEYVRAGDPVAINILRDSIALIDIGFFDPLQVLLSAGRIRPSAESVWTYYAMAPASLERSRAHVDMALTDLYWAAIDAAHAALMAIGEIPVSPSHVPEAIQKKLVEPGYVSKRNVDIMKHLYEISKKILHRESSGFDGKTYDRYRKLSAEFVDEMKKFIESKKIQ